ncbi:HAD-IA family hydrolase [Azospirillum sp. SYSU D00513]|uniref:HAD family hydrolase n=1 Tax=Azospirillum sp. SYSU D00513 TaxID=2812561 RepID=UPI001A96C4FC|nr:HAD-IA family hydrolase [Azospirillum sp. SYSU D00513]
MPKALLFDLDGTLAETDPLHFRAFAAMLRDHGVELTEEDYGRHITGRSNAVIMAHFLPGHAVEDHVRLAAAKEAAFRRLAEDLVPVEGLAALLDSARERDMKVALVTNAPRENAVHMLRVLGLADRFHLLVIGDELPHAKPHPLPYATALEGLGVTAEDAVAFEDSRTGIASAKGAGIFTVGLTTTHGAEELREAGADVICRDFADPALHTLLA